MKFHSIALNEGGTARNLTIQGGTSFPALPAEGELFYRSDADARIKGLYLFVNGSWDRISSTEALTVPGGAVLPAASNPGDLFYQTGTGMFVSDGTAWTSLNTGGSAATADDLTGGTAGALAYQSAANTTAFLPVGTVNQVLVSGALPSWTGTPVLSSVEAAQLSTNMSGSTSVPALDIGSNPAVVGPMARFRSGGTTVLTLDKTGILSLDGVVPSITVNSTAGGNSANLFFQQTALNRWRIGKDTAPETGANAGSDFFINSYQDNGTTMNPRVAISRATGAMSVPGGIIANVTGTLTGNASTATSATSATSASTVPWAGVTGRPTFHYNFATSTASPLPTQFPIETISGFNAYSSTDFPSSYWTGVTVLNAGLSGFQLAANWDAEETAPSGLIFRVNDDTNNAAAWGPWTTIWNSQNLTNVSQLTNDAGYVTSASVGSGFVSKTGDTMTGTLLLSSPQPDLRLSETDTSGAFRFTLDAGNFYLQRNQAAGKDFSLTSDVYRVAPNGDFFFGGNVSGINLLSVGGAATFASTISATSGTFTSRVSASGAEGFASSTFVLNTRNPIWRFGNADAFGLSYFQGTSGIGGSDTIGLHFGTASAAASQFQFNQNGSFNSTGAITQAGQQVWHTGNFSPSAYLPITGGTLSGQLGVNSGLNYPGFSSALNVGFSGSGTQFGLTFKPATSTGPTNVITFLTSTSTLGAPAQLGAIRQLTSDSAMELTGNWQLNGAAIATTPALSSYVLKTGDTMTGDLTLARVNPVLRLRDTDGTGSNMAAFISFRDSGDGERGWVGFGENNTVMRVSNGTGDLRLTASNVLVDGNGLSARAIAFPTGTNILDEVNGSPWYGVGRTSTDIFSDGSTQVQVAGFYGLRLRSNNAIIDMRTGGNINITSPRATFTQAVDVGTTLTCTNAGAFNTNAILTRAADGNFQLWARNGSGTNATGERVADLMLAYAGNSAETAGLRFYRGGGAVDTTMAFWAHNGERMSLNGTALLSTVGSSTARDGQGHDPYGAVAVTRGTASNFSYYGLTRAGQVGMGLGISTSNRFIVGASSAGHDGVISSPAMSLSMGGDVSFGGAVTTTSVVSSGSITTAGIEVGYLGIPTLSTTGGTAGTNARGRCYETTGGITVPSGTFSAGDTFTIDNVSAGNITITQGSGLTMLLAGTTTSGNRTLATNGICTIRFRSASVCVISGGGLS